MPDDPDHNRLQKWQPVMMIVAGAVLLVGIFAFHWRAAAALVKLATILFVTGIIRLYRGKGPSTRGSAIGSQGSNLAIAAPEPEDPGIRHAKAAVLLVPAFGFLAFSLKPTPMPFGGIYTRVFCVFAAYGLYKIAQGAGFIGPVRTQVVNQSRLARILLDGRKTGLPNPLGTSAEKVWRTGQLLGYGLVLLTIPCLIAFWAKTPTVLLTGEFDIFTGSMALAMLTLALFVGISWARLAASSLTGLFFRTLITSFAAFSLMMVPVILTGGEIAEYLAFSGPSIKSRQEFRVWWTYQHSSKGVRDYAVINPYHIERRTSGLLPEIPISNEAFQFIRQANPDARIDSNFILYSPEKSVRSTNLCLSFVAERVGPYERLLLNTHEDLPLGAVHPCSRDAR